MNQPTKNTDDISPRVLTVGHSTHPIGEFLELLHGAGVTRLVDVRTLPGSRHNPQFNEENLAPSLERVGIGYVREQRLGGLRAPTRTVDPDANSFWQNQSFHRYADYALSTPFVDGLDHLIHLATPGQLPVIMCSEAVWWRCHRRIIADYLLARDIPVTHLMPDGRRTPATLTRGAHPQADHAITYPAK